MKNIRLALFNIKKNFQNEKELKSTFIISILGMILSNTAFIIIWYYFGKKVGELNGWKSIDILGLYGFSMTSYGVTHAFCNGIYNIPYYITSGNLDKYLLTPKNTLIKIATSSVSTSALGDLTFGIVCFVIFAIIYQFSFLQVLIYILLMFVASTIFFAASLICMSLSFYFMDGENISDSVLGITTTTSTFQGGAFNEILRFVFTFIFPSLLMGAIPVEIVKEMSFPKLLLILILATFWLIASILFFYKSLKRYNSNSFFGFNS